MNDIERLKEKLEVVLLCAIFLVTLYGVNPV